MLNNVFKFKEGVYIVHTYKSIDSAQKRSSSKACVDSEFLP